MFPSPVSLFWELSPRPFPRFGAFLFLRVCCPGPVFSVGSEPDRFDGLNKFSPSWTRMVLPSFLRGAEWPSESCRIKQVRLGRSRRTTTHVNVHSREGPDAFPDNVMDYRTPWMRSDRLNLPTGTERFRRSRRIPEPRDGFTSTRDERQAKHHCQRQTRLGRSLRIPKHRNGCSTVNRVRSSRPSLTLEGSGAFQNVEMDVMSRQSRRLICQTAHGSLSTNSVKPTQPVSVSKARPRASRSSSAVEGRRATDETQRPTTHRVRVPGEKTRKSEPTTQRGYELSTQSSRTPSSRSPRLKTEKWTKNKGTNPKTGVVTK